MPWDTMAECLHTGGDYPGRASDMLRTARQPRIEFRSSPGCPEPGLSHMKLPTRSLRGWWLGSRPVVVGAWRWDIPCSAAWPRASAAPPACRPRPCPGLHLRLPDGLVLGVMPLGKAPPTCAPWFRKPATAEMPSGGRRHIRTSPPRSAEQSSQDRGSGAAAWLPIARPLERTGCATDTGDRSEDPRMQPASSDPVCRA